MNAPALGSGPVRRALGATAFLLIVLTASMHRHTAARARRGTTT
jgi:hypothetical protein